MWFILWTRCKWWKKVNGNWDIINYDSVTLKLTEDESHGKCYGYQNPSDDMYRACPWSSWTIPANIVVETWVKNCTARLYNHGIGMRNYLLKSNFKFNLQKHHFVYVYEVIIKCYLNFITCLYFPLALIRWNSSHCHLMELFKSKESCKEKFDSNNNWKTAWPRMILEWHLFLRLSLGFVWKMLSFVGKHLSFYPKDVCSFSVFFI